MSRLAAPPDRSLAYANLGIKRARCEVMLLASIAGSVRAAVVLLDELGITDADFENADTRVIFEVLSTAGRDTTRRPWTRTTMAIACRELLKKQHSWDNSDRRQFVHSSRFGPGPLARLLCTCPYDPAVVTAVAQKLRQIDQQQQLLAETMR